MRSLRRKNWLLPATATLALGIACFAVVVGIWAVSLSRDLDQEQTKLHRQLAAHYTDRTALNMLLRTAGRTPIISPGQRVQGALFVGFQREAFLVVCGIAAPQGKSLRAWVIHQRTRLPAGIVSGATGGTLPPPLGEPKCSTTRLVRPVPKGAMVEVTLEPEGRVERPEGPRILEAQAA